jgi:hypothetical protein
MPSNDHQLDPKRLARIATLQLGVLSASGVLAEGIAGGRLVAPGTPVYDINGELLFHRTPITAARGKEVRGYVDIAANPALGGPVIAVSTGVQWDADALLEQAQRALRRKHKGSRHDEARFVAYSFPKVAVQFLARGAEVAMIELFTWTPVPERRERYDNEPPGNFERWSYLDEQPARQRRRNVADFEEKIPELERIITEFKLPLRRIEIDRAIFDRWVLFTDSRELHYSKRNGDHLCYELRGQETNVWCVGASVQMILDFYRYQYTQTRLAVDLGLGTPSNPNGLPYTRDGDVVVVLENLSSKALSSVMNASPSFGEFRTEIRANRPLVSFVPGHSRTVAGYTRTTSVLLPALGYRGLLVYDPWPPNAGVITRWENFDTTTYRRTFTARVTLA